MKTKIIYFTIALFIAFLSVVIGGIMGIIMQEDAKQDQKNNQTFSDTSEMEEALLLSLSFDDDVDLSQIVISDSTDSLITYKDYVKGQPYIVFRYDMSDCDLCINSQRDVIIDVMNELSIENMLIMASFKNLREKHICMNKEKGIFRNFVEYPKGEEGNPLKELDEYSIPYFFVTDGKCHLRKLFFPIKSNLLLTRRYIYTIYSCYNIK